MKKITLISVLMMFFVLSVEADELDGRDIYLYGRLHSGQAVKASRNIGPASGADAACVNCHRPSGMGSVEGNILMPPITGNALGLNDSGASSVTATMDLRSRKSFNPLHPPYTQKQLADAIRKGIKSDGTVMADLMPRYALSDLEVSALIKYLGGLSETNSEGATDTAIHLATVITPDVSEEKKRIFLNLLNKKITVKNSSTVVGQTSGRRHAITAAEFYYGTERKWNHQIWELHGDPSTWEDQLNAYYQKKPVFALLSGLGSQTWQPVSDFCEKKQVPCWFPSVDIPGRMTHQNYSLYFNQGVRLEAGLLLDYLAQQDPVKTKKVVQIYKNDFIGNASAQSLGAISLSTHQAIANVALDEINEASLTKAFSGLEEGDVLMLWLGTEDLVLLNHLTPPKNAVYISGRLGAFASEQLNPTWKRAVRMIYPYELPARRQLSLDHFHQWMQTFQMPVVDEPLQAEVYFAVEYLGDTLTDMLNNMYRDYLLERAESQLSINQVSKSEQRALLRKSIKPIGREVLPDLDKNNNQVDPKFSGLPKGIGSGSTTIYPRMSLGNGERFASKGGYVVRFKDENSNVLEDLSGWIVPGNLDN